MHLEIQDGRQIVYLSNNIKYYLLCAQYNQIYIR